MLAFSLFMGKAVSKRCFLHVVVSSSLSLCVLPTDLYILLFVWLLFWPLCFTWCADTECFLTLTCKQYKASPLAV